MPDGFPAVGFPVAPGYKLALPMLVSHTRFVATCPQKDIPDFKVAQKIKTMGFRDSPTGELVFAGISILPVPDGTVMHPTAAARTKFCSSHNRPAPETVTQPALTCDRLEPLFSGHFSDTGPPLRRVFVGVPR